LPAEEKISGGMHKSKPTTSSSASTTTRCGAVLMAGFLHILAIRPLFLAETVKDTEPVQLHTTSRGLHRAWLVAIVAFVTLIGAAGFRSVPSVLIDPLHEEFGWARGTISAAVSINLVLFGLISPFAAALMDRLGIRRVVAWALVLVAAGSGLTVFMTSSWQLLLCWGVLVGVGTGSMSMAFVATVTGRWFVRRRGLVSGVLTAAGATGQLVFLPLVASLATTYGWRTSALVVAFAALAVVPLVLLFLHNHPSDVGTAAYGAGPDDEPEVAAGAVTGSSAARALRSLRDAARTRTFWLLAGALVLYGAPVADYRNFPAFRHLLRTEHAEYIEGSMWHRVLPQGRAITYGPPC